MRLVIVLAAVAAVVSGCQTTASAPPTAALPNPELASGYKRPTDEQANASARKLVASKMKDPDSAKFADMARKTTPNARGEPTDVICGMVNAKNGFGGYTGNRQFVYFVARNDANLAEGDEVDRVIVRNFCVGFGA